MVLSQCGNLWVVCLRLILACICGGTIGFERTKRLKEAGIRTHCIIASASALIMLVSIHGFGDLGATGEVVNGVRTADAARIAASVVTGVSFLGAGVIFRNGNSVKGLTTAAGIWATAGVGLSIGGGMYLPGILLTVMVVGIQVLFHHFSIGNDAYSENDVHIVATATPTFRTDFFQELEKRDIQLLSLKIEQKNGEAEFNLTIRTKKNCTAKDIAELSDKYPEIRSVSMTA